MASRSRSMDITPGDKTLDFFPPEIPPVDASRSGITSPTSSSASEPDTDDRRRFECNFFRALDAHSGVGLIRSYCLRNLRSYSRPPTASSEGASRSFRKRLSEVKETCMFASSGSTQAGAFLRVDRRASPEEVSCSCSPVTASSAVSSSCWRDSSSSAISASSSSLNAMRVSSRVGAFFDEGPALSSMKNSCTSHASRSSDNNAERLHQTTYI